jgi:hypothetical protein
VILLRQLIYDHYCRADLCIYCKDRMNPSGDRSDTVQPDKTHGSSAP